MSKNHQLPDFTNTELAFASKSDKQLSNMRELFYMMNKRWLVDIGSKVALWAVKLRLKFVDKLLEKTIFPQFCGGTSLDNSSSYIQSLYDYGILSILDYGAEAKSDESSYEITKKENLKCVQFANGQTSVPAMVTKVSGLFDNDLLEKNQSGIEFTKEEAQQYQRSIDRLEEICQAAHYQNVSIFIDAEESWIQDSIDQLANTMMARFNKKRVVVYNTYQMYRKDRLDYLKASFDDAQKHKYLLGAKVVRGAYMDKERTRATEMGYPSPIHDTKEDSDKAFNAAIEFCIDHYEQIGFCNASHNLTSCALQARLIQDKGLDRQHPHLNFCQLLGMSDNITYNLSANGYNVAKYMVYGAVNEVVPYLIRRAQENSSVAGDVSRELHLLDTEIARRKG